MSARRAPSAPPHIPGFEMVELLGSGGFADVFLFQQQMPRRRVAVKVMLPDQLNQDFLGDFRAEANLMAALSSHPSIVTIFGADISADGRPFLVMEYCSRGNLGSRYRKERFAVPEVLRLGVQIAGAIETAHRAGILHRDIKPANILVTDYNRPALTDFGIATEIGTQDLDAQGMSVPWSPPEAFDSPPRSGRESDVYSLAATLWTLLAGRTPFEIPGMSNSSIDLITRIQRGELVDLARSDVSPGLQSVLRTAMDPRPDRRYSSALAFGRALQQAETELHLPVTSLDVMDESLPADVVEEDDAGATRIRGVVTIDPNPASPARHAAPAAAAGIPAVGARMSEHTVLHAPVTGITEDSVGVDTAPRTRPKALIPLIVGGLVVVAAAAVIVFASFMSGSSTPVQLADPDDTVAPIDSPSTATPPAPIHVTATVDGDEIRFDWVNPQPEDGDQFVWYVTQSGTQGDTQLVATTTVTVPAGDGETCVFVALLRDSGRQSPFAQGCSSG